MNTDQIEGTAKDVIGKAEGGIGNATGSSRLQGDGMIDQVTGTAQKVVGQATDAVKDIAGKAQDGAQMAVKQGASYMNDKGSTLSDQVQSNPMMALAIAATVGFFVGYLLHRS